VNEQNEAQRNQGSFSKLIKVGEELRQLALEHRLLAALSANQPAKEYLI
jgi:hypothetical protein